MMRAGPVAAQPTLPPKSGVEGVRGADAQRDGKAAIGESEEDFDGLLAQLKGGASQSSEDSVRTEASASPRELTSLRRHDVEAQLASEENGSDPELADAGDRAEASDLNGGSLVDGLADALAADRAPARGPEVAAVSQSNIAAMAAGRTAGASVEGDAAQPAGASSECRGSDAARAARAVAAAHLAQDATQPAPSEAHTASVAPVQNDGGRSLAAAADANLARSGIAESAAGNGKPEPGERGKKSASAADLSRTSAGQRAGTVTQLQQASVVAEAPKASVVQQETHFAPIARSSPAPHVGPAAAETGPPAIAAEAQDANPVAAPTVDAALLASEAGAPAGGSPAQQIAERIIAETASGPEFAHRAAAAFDQPAMKPTLKILQVQLQPAELGTVNVRMELKESQLTLRVEAERPETADLIRGDQDGLTKLLRSAGYGVDASSIRIVESDRSLASQQPSGQQGAQANLQSSPQSQSGGSERQGHAQRDNGAPNGGEAQPQSSRNDTHETTTISASRGLYI